MRKNKKDWDLEALLSVIGFVFELMRTVVVALRKRGGTVDHLRRLLKEPALVDKVFDLIVDKAMVVLLEGEYLVPVDYGPNPSQTELERDEFSGEGSVSALFDGRPREKHRSCAKIDETNGDRVMRLFHFDEEIESEEIESEEAIARADKEGYRPATEKEARAFAKAHPELQREFWIVALGSFAVHDGGAFVAVLSGDSDGRYLGDRWFGSWWACHRRFLFVRK